MGSTESFVLREEALEALAKSTTILKVALGLIEQGNYAEAERLRNQAHTQRTISTLLMLEANNREKERRSIPRPRPTTPNSRNSTQVRRQSERRAH